MIAVTLYSHDKEWVEQIAKDLGVSYEHFLNRLVNMYDANFHEEVLWMADLFRSTDEDELAIVNECKPDLTDAKQIGRGIVGVIGPGVPSSPLTHLQVEERLLELAQFAIDESWSDVQGMASVLATELAV